MINLLYDTILDAILTCTRKPTTKSVKTEKKVKRRICSEVTVNSLGNAYSES